MANDDDSNLTVALQRRETDRLLDRLGQLSRKIWTGSV
jgi:hypothetical protein